MKRPSNRYKNQRAFEQALSCEQKHCRKEEDSSCGCSLSVTEKENELKVKNDRLDLVVRCKNKNKSD